MTGNTAAVAIHSAGSNGVSTPVRQEITIVNELGLQARRAAEFVCVAKAFRSEVWLIKGEERFSAASILDVLVANLNYGEAAVIEAQGPDAEGAVKHLVHLITRFGEQDLNNKTSAFRRPEEDF